jgi:hypothetical protein
MSTISLENIREEICHTLRNNDIFTTTIRGVTTTTDSFTATAGQTNFTLTHTNVKNVRSLTVNSVAKYFINDYTINFSTGVVTLLVGANLNDPVVIQYDYGSPDKIYPDMPRDDLSLTSFPRIGISLVSITTEPFGLGGMNHLSDILISIYLWMPVNKDSNIAGGLGGANDINTYMGTIRSVIRAQAKSFYSFKYITPTGSSPIIVGTNQKIIQLSSDFTIKFVTEIN